MSRDEVTASREVYAALGRDGDEHQHVWGPVERSRFAGTLHRACSVPFCYVVSLDLDDGDEYGDEVDA